MKFQIAFALTATLVMAEQFVTTDVACWDLVVEDDTPPEETAETTETAEGEVAEGEPAEGETTETT